MKQWLYGLVLFIFLQGFVSAQTKDLQVEGEGVRTITQASKFPFVVKAPEGADFYLWKYPPETIAQDTLTGTLAILGAPKGELTITVIALMVEVDFEKKTKKTTTKVLSTTVRVITDGTPEPPKPDPPKPDPPKPPDNPLVTKLKLGLWGDGDTVANKAALVKLAEVARYVAKEVPPWKDATAGMVAQLWSLSAKNAVGLQVLQTRKAAADWIEGQVTWPLNAAMSESQKTALAGYFTTLAKGLEDAAK